jgi:predicted dehydrogenase
MKHSRRRFLKNSGQALAVTGLAGGLPLSTEAKPDSVSPTDTLVVGLIGCRGMGFGDLRNHLRQPDVVCGGLCDVDETVLQERATEVEQMTGRRPRLYRDFRRMLEETDIDAVIIGTPDHWHCLQMVYACQAGKDVYVEKPIANSIAECDLMVRAAERYERIVQVGQQQRSGQHWQDVVAFVQSGQLGTIRQVKVWGFFDYGKGGPRVPDDTPPSTLNYDMWLGPAPEQPYNPNRLHGSWRHQWSFGGGLITDWGVHLLDVVLWAMHVDEAPKSVSAVGGIYAYPDRAIETPDTLSVLYEMDGYTLSWEHTGGIENGYYDRHYGMAFIGNNGTLVANRSGWEMIPEVRDDLYALDPFPPRSGQQSNHEAHAINFIKSAKDRTTPICTIEDGRRAAFYAHLGNIAFRSGSRLIWDDTTHSFTDNPTANAYLTPTYRAPWTWPKF